MGRYPERSDTHHGDFIAIVQLQRRDRTTLPTRTRSHSLWSHCRSVKRRTMLCVCVDMSCKRNECRSCRGNLRELQETNVICFLNDTRWGIITPIQWIVGLIPLPSPADCWYHLLVQPVSLYITYKSRLLRLYSTLYSAILPNCLTVYYLSMWVSWCISA